VTAPPLDPRKVAPATHGTRTGVLMSLFAVAVAISVSLVAYPIYWHSLTARQFSVWFSVVELGTLFIPLDFGLSERFIKVAVGERADRIDALYQRLRSDLARIALVAFCIQIPIYLAIAHTQEVNDYLPFVVLALCPALGVMCYAESALLRTQSRFVEIYGLNAFASLLFLGLVLALSPYGILGLSLAALARSATIYGGQLYMARAHHHWRMPRFPFSGVSWGAFLANASYLTMFSFDGVLFLSQSAAPAAVSGYLMNRKPFDVLKGLFDAAMAVVFVRIARMPHNLGLAVVLVCGFVAGAMVVYLAGAYALGWWIGPGVHDAAMSAAIACAVVAVVTSRVVQMFTYVIVSEAVATRAAIAQGLAKAGAVGLYLSSGLALTTYHYVLASLMVAASAYSILMAWSYRRQLPVGTRASS
jgi:hypothetical protein